MYYYILMLQSISLFYHEGIKYCLTISYIMKLCTHTEVTSVQCINTRVYIYISIYLSIYLLICLFNSICRLSAYLSNISLSVFLSLKQSINLSSVFDKSTSAEKPKILPNSPPFTTPTSVIGSSPDQPLVVLSPLKN